MSATSTSSPAARARTWIADRLEAAGIAATLDAGAFFPQPNGVIVGLPTLTARGLGSRSYSIPVDVVSGDPLNSELAVDRLYALADDVALACHCDAYRPTSWRGGVNAEPLPSIQLTATVTVPEEVPAS